MIRATILGVLVGVAPAVAASPAALAAAREYLMGTIAEVRVHAADEPAAAVGGLEAALAELRIVDRLMAVQRAESDVSRLNRSAGDGPVTVDRRVIEVLRRSLAVGRMTDGAFDVTVLPVVRAWGFTDGAPHRPTGPVPRVAGAAALRIDEAHGTVALDRGAEVDLGGIAKGYALDRARDVLRAHGVRSAWLDLGGNVATLGEPPGERYWRVGVRHPRREGRLLGTLEVGETAVSTSGDAEQFTVVDGTRVGHIVDPRTGAPARGLASATVVHPDATLADALSTATVVLGAARAHTMLVNAGAGAVMIAADDDGHLDVTTTPGLRFHAEDR